jgi:hypothetical protein
LLDDERSPVSLAEKAAFGMTLEIQLLDPILRARHALAYSAGCESIEGPPSTSLARYAFARNDSGYGDQNCIWSFSPLGLRFQWKQFDIPEENFGAFRLDQDLSTGGIRFRALVHKLAVQVLLYVIPRHNKFYQVPLAVGVLHLAIRIAVSCNILRRTRIEASNSGG